MVDLTGRWLTSSLVVLTALLLSTCSGGDIAPIPLPARDDVETLRADCDHIYARQVFAWAARDPQALREIYTDDIIHFDGEPAFEGIEEVVDMAEMMFRSFPDWQMAPGDTYVSAAKCAGAWRNWGIFGMTQDEPGLEYDLLEVRGERISHWRLFYDEVFYGAWNDDFQIDPAFTDAYIQAWSGGQPRRIARLYTEEAILTDTLFDVTAEGRAEIGQYAAAFLARSPDAVWTLRHPFAEGDADWPYEEAYPHAAQGGIFGVSVEGPSGTPCRLRAMVILTPDDKGRIREQEVLWAADTLIACGWVE